MYRHGLGDCFLLTFPRKGSGASKSARPYHVLIDCGIIPGTPEGVARIRQVADEGKAALIVSDELDDLRVCDRVVAMFHGRIVAEFDVRGPIVDPRGHVRVEARGGPLGPIKRLNVVSLIELLPDRSRLVAGIEIDDQQPAEIRAEVAAPPRAFIDGTAPPETKAQLYIDLPAVGDTVEAGAVVGELESTKSVIDIYAPVSGEVIARNDALEGGPEVVNSDPYGEGWLVKIRASDDDPRAGLLEA